MQTQNFELLGFNQIVQFTGWVPYRYHPPSQPVLENIRIQRNGMGCYFMVPFNK